MCEAEGITCKRCVFVCGLISMGYSTLFYTWGFLVFLNIYIPQQPPNDGEVSNATTVRTTLAENPRFTTEGYVSERLFEDASSTLVSSTIDVSNVTAVQTMLPENTSLTSVKFGSKLTSKDTSKHSTLAENVEFANVKYGSELAWNETTKHTIPAQNTLSTTVAYESVRASSETTRQTVMAKNTALSSEGYGSKKQFGIFSSDQNRWKLASSGFGSTKIETETATATVVPATTEISNATTVQTPLSESFQFTNVENGSEQDFENTTPAIAPATTVSPRNLGDDKKAERTLTLSFQLTSYILIWIAWVFIIIATWVPNRCCLAARVTPLVAGIFGLSGESSLLAHAAQIDVDMETFGQIFVAIGTIGSFSGGLLVCVTMTSDDQWRGMSAEELEEFYHPYDPYEDEDEDELETELERLRLRRSVSIPIDYESPDQRHHRACLPYSPNDLQISEALLDFPQIDIGRFLGHMTENDEKAPPLVRPNTI